MNNEAKTLLRHPDYRERMLALKLDSVTPHDLAVAILDPHQEVFKAAFHHPMSSHALDVLAASNRDAAGNTIKDRHDYLLQDPRCTQDHVDSMHRAIEHDSFMPIHEQNARLNELESLTKGVMSKNRLSNYEDPLEKIIKVSQEENKHPELLQEYNKAVHGPKPIEPQEIGADLRGASPKVVYHINGEKQHKFLVKPYLEEPVPMSGWNEASSQNLYQAAGLPHLHQKSFVASYDNGDRHIPATVIEMEKAGPVHFASKEQIENPENRESARKIAIMDFLTGNADRHTNNLMVRENGKLLAIDHGRAFSYNADSYAPSRKKGTALKRYSLKAPRIFASEEMPQADADYHNTLSNWWPSVAPDVKRAFQKRLELINNQVLKLHLEAGFNARHNWLNQEAQNTPEQFAEDLKKALKQEGHELPVVEEVPPKATKYSSVHNELLNSHPQHLQPQVDYFEKHVNDPSKKITPERADLEGIEKKSLVKHGGNTYLIKGAHTQWNPLSGWGEMTSQAMYHAGGIGDLHQHVHATHLNVNKNGKIEKHPVVVIHFKKGDWASKKRPNLNEDNRDDLRKIYLMDFLTGNGDRHDQNILFNEEEKPQAIDQGFAFRRDDWSDPTEQNNEDRTIKGNGLSFLPPHNRKPFYWEIFNSDYEGGGINNADENTYNWWKEHKDPIVKTFNRHLDMIPDKTERDRRRAMFNYRVDAIDNRHPVVFDDTFEKSEEDLAKGAMQRLYPFDPRKEGESVVGERISRISNGKGPLSHSFKREKEVLVAPGEFEKFTGMQKSLGNASFLHDQHGPFKNDKEFQSNFKTLHENLMKAHPAKINPGVRHFELTINQSKNPVRPTKKQEELEGVQPKSLYHSGGKGYLVKTAIEPSTSLGVWNELTSQAMYHAGNIGHLHQKAHATVGKTGLNREEPSQALAIHMEPDSMTFNDAAGWEDFQHNKFPGQDVSRTDKALTNPEHLGNLQKIGMMDYLTGNGDRHGANILVKPDGSVIAIDHGRAFYDDRKHALGRETDTELIGPTSTEDWHDYEPDYMNDPNYAQSFVNHYDDQMENSAAAGLGGKPTKESLGWWEQNKEPILEKFKEHLNMLPNADTRQRMLNSFMVRYNRLGDLARTFRPKAPPRAPVSGYEKTLKDVDKTV